MKAVKATLSLVVFVFGAIASVPALAWHHGGHAHFGVFIGGPGYWYPPYYYPPYYPPHYTPAAPVLSALLSAGSRSTVLAADLHRAGRRAAGTRAIAVELVVLLR